ncbi:uncharacterized protein LOC131239274 [Magnolia sinica]|uniref:uncharacterized protein LOC131239274 n=1 Tax=Magnolia sinica TaxID=86752 RepID=UPI00265A46ED|nr:uncharacterized protein LOC131239274 [Magnolia sinica]
MKYSSQWWILSSAILLLTTSVHASRTLLRNENGVKTAVFLSPPFELGSGSVANKNYFDVDFPKGHIALKDFNAEIIDAAGNPVPLHETYLHHWLMARYYGLTSAVSNVTFVRNSGVCQGNVLAQYYGLGSETRRTLTYVPDPYGIEVGNPAQIPNGYEEGWLLIVHAIDTRGVVDRMGCTECRCELYNVTKDANGMPLSKDYPGGLSCCYDQTQCKVIEGCEHEKRELYLRYAVKWVDWDESIVPAKIYILDATDSGERENSTDQNAPLVGCQVEYQVESCSASMEKGLCVDAKKTSVVMPRGGNVIYGVAHQHAGGVGSTVYGQDGRVICSSIPIYGDGNEVGNEDGYVVGMSTCYPKPGSVKIMDGEVLTLESNYNNSQMHAGVMGLFYMLVADLPLKE